MGIASEKEVRIATEQVLEQAALSTSQSPYVCVCTYNTHLYVYICDIYICICVACVYKYICKYTSIYVCTTLHITHFTPSLREIVPKSHLVTKSSSESRISEVEQIFPSRSSVPHCEPLTTH